ncbi:MAG: hypothetical protein JWO13_2271 [Acidobacteriales bacterium]|nr:hypothetical protein [Terriglobales bacterium]
MADNSKIEWTDASWNPVRGCSRVSEGCRNCYAEGVAARFNGPGQAYEGLAEFKIIGQGTKKERREAHWTGKVSLVERHLEDPLRWRRPRKIFVNSMSDLFHESIPDSWIAIVYGIMAMAHRHTFQILTKRPERQRDFLNMLAAASDPAERLLELAIDADGDPYFSDPAEACISNAIHDVLGVRGGENWNVGWPMRHVQQGVSVEDGKTALARIPILLRTAAAVRFISAEPLLGAIDLSAVQPISLCGQKTGTFRKNDCERLDWVIAGGESGPKARPMHPDWARQLRDQCVAAGVPFFFKQWGEWAPGECADKLPDRTERVATWFANKWDFEQLTPKQSEETHSDDAPDVYRLGKHAAGALLDGEEWKQFPSVQTIAGVTS